MCRNSAEIQLLPRTLYDFTYLSNGASQTIVLRPALSVVAYYRVHLLVRLHSSQMASGQSLVFQVDHTLPSDDDPAEFIDPGVAGPLTTVSIDSTTSSPLLLAGTATDLEAALRVRFVATQGSVPSTPFFAELSAVLVLRDF